MKLVDTHCHIDFEAFEEDRAQVLQRARDNDVCAIVVPATQQSRWQHLLEVCRQSSGYLYPALGLHPMFLDAHCDDHIEQLQTAVSQAGVVAVGEIGLDFYLRDLNRKRQLELCAAQLAVAVSVELPVILHIRKAYDELLTLLQSVPVCGGIAHAFNGSLQQAHKLIDRGFKLGFGGTMTYSNARRIHALARKLPIDSIVLETDAPDMVVSAWRGSRNSPEYLPYCVRALAELKGLAMEEIAMTTTRNASQCLQLDVHWEKSKSK